GAADVGEVVVCTRLGGAGGRQEEALLDPGIGQRVVARRKHGAPRRAGTERDRVVRRAALYDAVGVEERRAHGLRDSKLVEVTARFDRRVACAEGVTRVPVPIVRTHLERAAERTREAIGVQLAVGGAGHFPAAAAEMGINARWIEVAVS